MGFHAKNCNVVEHCSMYILYIDELHPFFACFGANITPKWKKHLEFWEKYDFTFIIINEI